MDIAAILFQTVSDLTGGLITDIKTAMVGMIALFVIVLGVDLLLAVLNVRVGSLIGGSRRKDDENGSERSERDKKYAEQFDTGDSHRNPWRGE